MKQFILPLVALLGMASPIFAETTTLGYVAPGCELSGDNGANKADAWSSGAIFVPASTLRSMSGAQITTIKAGLQSKLHIDGLKVWLRYDLDGENIAEGTAETVKKGWIDVALDTPWTIPSDIENGVYVGFSVHQTGTSYALANNFQPTNGGWFTNIDEQGWVDHSESGTLCVEAVVEGDNLPATNLSLLSIDAPQAYVVKNGNLSGSMFLKNHGTKPVGSFDVSLLVDGDKDAVQHIQVPIAPGEVVTVPFVLQPRLTVEDTFNVSYIIDGIDTGDDADMSDNVADRSLKVLELPIERVVLIEEFTTEQCGNCPAAANTLSSYVHNPEYEGRIAVVCHHSGYYTDKFTTDFDKDYTWFYNSGSTYAPAMMIDRNTVASTPVMQVSSQSLNRELANRYAKPAQLGLLIEGDFDENNPDNLVIRVIGKNYTNTLCDNPTITLYLVENNIHSSTQSFGGSDFIHQHVGRAVNSTWGVPVEFDKDNTFEYYYTFNISSSWNKSNLEVIAAVHNKDMSNPANWEVQNAAFLKAENFALDNVQGIDTEEMEVEAEYFTLDGIRVDSESLAPGIYVRKAGDKVSKVVIR